MVNSSPQLALFPNTRARLGLLFLAETCVDGRTEKAVVARAEDGRYGHLDATRVQVDVAGEDH